MVGLYIFLEATLYIIPQGFRACVKQMSATGSRLYIQLSHADLYVLM